MTKSENGHQNPGKKASTTSRPKTPFLRDEVRSAGGTQTPSATARHVAKEDRSSGRRQLPPSERLPSRVPKGDPPPSTQKDASGAIISRRASERLRGGHLWVYASDIERLDVSTDSCPALLPVADNRGLLLGTALYSPASQIVLRIISRKAVSQSEWLMLLSARLGTAIDRRSSMFDAETNAGRLVFSEADELPGVVIDKYGQIVVVQLLCKGLDTTETRRVCAEVLAEKLGSEPLTVWERADPRIRELEGLSLPPTGALFSNMPDAPATHAVFRLNGLEFHFDVNSGQKTGAFLDQRENYAAAASWARRLGAKAALDVCTYQGGFALHLARVCDHVTGIDASHASLAVAERNQAANKGALSGNVEWIEADAFELLRRWSSPLAMNARQGEEEENGSRKNWDLIVLDPPAFAKSKRALEGALRGYKELNLRAMMLLKSGGLLITCSCSHHVSWADLEGAVASAAVDAQRRVTLLERRGAALDHPIVLTLPETEYLKCLICLVD